MIRSLGTLGASVLVMVGLALGGCSAPVEDDDSTSGTGALSQGELEVEAIVTNVASTAPKTTGVDRWRLSLVTKDGDSYFVAIGSKGTADVLDVVLGSAAGSTATAKVISHEDIEPTEAFGKALAADLLAIRAALPTESTATTQGLHIQGGSQYGGAPCNLARIGLLIGVVSTLASGALTVASCGGTIASGGAAAGLCVITGTLTVQSIKNAHTLYERTRECAAEGK